MRDIKRRPRGAQSLQGSKGPEQSEELAEVTVKCDRPKGYNYRGAFALSQGETSAPVEVSAEELTHLQAVDGISVKVIRRYPNKELVGYQAKDVQ